MATVSRFNEMSRAGDRFRFPSRTKRIRPLLRRPHHHPEPEPAAARQGAVLRGEDGAQRSRHLRRPASRRPCPGAARRRHVPSTGCTRSATPPPTRSARPIPGRARRSRRAWCTATSPHTDAADESSQSGSSASAFFSISYQNSGGGPRNLRAAVLRPGEGGLRLVEFLDHLQGQLTLVGVIPLGPLQPDARIRPRRIRASPLGVLGCLALHLVGIGHVFVEDLFQPGRVGQMPERHPQQWAVLEHRRVDRRLVRPSRDRVQARLVILYSRRLRVPPLFSTRDVTKPSRSSFFSSE